ncbi:MAG: D-2-hydroxyacid dehydrogenase [Chitinophagaceae bacterium]|nr:D-2-hydroxyacid dehydrogenase [Chitinophagaceae bacterium]
MKIVITDGFTLNPGDLNWAAFEKLGNVQYYDRTAPVEVIARCFDADIIVTNKTIIDEDVIMAGSHLKMIAVTATGYNNVDTVAAKNKKVVVCNAPGYGTQSVAQHTFALLLELCNGVGNNADSVSRGGWTSAKDWCYSLHPIIELNKKITGIIGMGEIGRQVAAIAHAFGMQVIYTGGHSDESYCSQVSLYELFIQSDFVTLHCPLTGNNKEFINKEMLGLMKPTAYLINTARGALINEKELAQVLYQHKIAGAALDVLSVEPPAKDNPLIGLSNCIITPHNAWMSAEARQRIMDITLGNIRAFMGEHPQNVVNS